MSLKRYLQSNKFIIYLHFKLFINLIITNTMRNLIFISGATILVAGLVVLSCRKLSCRKDSSSVLNVDKHTKSFLNMNDKSVFDEVGRKHNELLDLYDYDRIDLGIYDAARYFDSILVAQGLYSELTPDKVLADLIEADVNC